MAASIFDKVLTLALCLRRAPLTNDVRNLLTESVAFTEITRMISPMCTGTPEPFTKLCSTREEAEQLKNVIERIQQAVYEADELSAEERTETLFIF